MLELPDPNRDLYYQVLGLAAVRFHRFRQLPTELRLRIWRDCLPAPRDVRASEIDERVNPPITLSINQESRHETLKHYSAIYLSWLTPPKGPIFCDPTRDAVHTNSSLLCSPQNPLWFELLSWRLPDFLKTIKSLEVHDISLLERKAKGIGLGKLAGLSSFTGLEELIFSPCAYHDLPLDSDLLHGRRLRMPL